MSFSRFFNFKNAAVAAIGGGYIYDSVGSSLAESKLIVPNQQIRPIFGPGFDSDILDYDDCSAAPVPSDSKELERGSDTLRELKNITLALGEIPVSPLEADCAIECIQSNKEHLRALLPPQIHVDAPKVRDILATVKHIVTDPSMIKTMMKKMEEKSIQNGEISSTHSEEDSSISSVSQNSSVQSELITTHLYASTTEGPVLSWEDLAQRYGCTICQDVLAAPTILNCSHNFCGSCLEDWRNSCVATDDNVEVVQTCPMCKCEVECCIFERAFDAEICQAVEPLPDSEAKVEWSTRRSSYLEHRKRVESIKSSRQDEEEETEEEAFDEVWETLKALAVPVITLAVLYLIVVCRK